MYRARAVAGADGVARIRVPYPSEATGPARALGSWRVSSGGSARCVALDERDVREGAVVPVPSGAACGP
jgi:hypothetical protein